MSRPGLRERSAGSARRTPPSWVEVADRVPSCRGGRAYWRPPCGSGPDGPKRSRPAAGSGRGPATRRMCAPDRCDTARSVDELTLVTRRTKGLAAEYVRCEDLPVSARHVYWAAHARHGFRQARGAASSAQRRSAMRASGRVHRRPGPLTAASPSLPFLLAAAPPRGRFCSGPFLLRARLAPAASTAVIGRGCPGAVDGAPLVHRNRVRPGTLLRARPRPRRRGGCAAGRSA